VRARPLMKFLPEAFAAMREAAKTLIILL